MLQRRMRRALAASILTAAMALTAPVQGEAAGFRTGADAPDLWTVAIHWLGSWWAEVSGGGDKQGSGIDPDGRNGESGIGPDGSSSQTVEPIEPDKGSGIDPDG
ncbi:MAG TPA: hypothetical protein VMW27_05400 [Thermoanaerobaculia bacterium]|nr:hypothetical protein [Thermoanaerobaculia bacterium]